MYSTVMYFLKNVNLEIWHKTLRIIINPVVDFIEPFSVDMKGEGEGQDRIWKVNRTNR